MFLSRFYLLIFLSSVLAATDYESPNPNFDCSNTKFQFSYTSCSAEDRSQCCPIGTPCCAGGCCSQDSHCVGGGTSKEGCCPLTALDRCGVDLKDIKAPVICSGGLQGSYQCPFGSECAPDGGCLGATGTAKAPGAKTASQTISIPVASRADPPGVSATSGGGTVVGAAAPSGTATKPNAAAKRSVAAFSFMASIVLALALL